MPFWCVIHYIPSHILKCHISSSMLGINSGLTTAYPQYGYGIGHLHRASIISTHCQLSRENVFPWTHYSKPVVQTTTTSSEGRKSTLKWGRWTTEWIYWWLLHERNSSHLRVSHDCTTSCIFFKYILKSHKLCMLGYCNTKGAGKGLFQHLLYSQP